ncbi:MAG: C-GCAxxG-C-C family protein, partial [Ruminococcus sp.]|nr:C-GCAxxG-C-C family protein [Ruminococcus sp.]
YHLVQEFARRFREKNGSIICRDLLSGTAVRQGNDPEARTAAYYKKRPCPALVRQAAEILDEMLDHNG